MTSKAQSQKRLKGPNHKNFDPNRAATAKSGIFGLPYSINDAKLILIPVPWEATTSYGGGTSQGPNAIFEASKQVDLYDLELGNFFEAGIAMGPAPKNVAAWNKTAKKSAQKIIKAGGEAKSTALKTALKQVNELSLKVNDAVYNDTVKYLKSGKIVGLIGGDHSAPFGAIQAHLEKYPRLGILHFDAHADLRQAYEGFKHSHASIMFNVLNETKLEKLVQVGIRDFGEQEFQTIQSEKGRVYTFFDQTLKEQKMNGKTWDRVTEMVLGPLPEEVYVSFDIDGLDPQFCPHTGTPVPGGLSYDEALYLLKRVVRSGRKIVGFDLNEVAPGPRGNEWDANVGARLLYKLCGWSLYRDTSLG